MNAARLLEYFDRIAEAPDAVSRLRKFILDLAVRGKLVEQDQNDEPASELLKRIHVERVRLVKVGALRKLTKLPEISAEQDVLSLPNNWVNVRLGEIIYLLSGQHLQPNEYSNDIDSGVPYITGPSDFGDSGLVISRYALIRKAVATKGQLLLTVKGSGVGKSTFCDQDEVAISRQLMALTAIKWSQEYLFLVVHLLSESLKEKARSLIPGISRDDVELFVFGLPPLAEQHRIVAKVDELMALCDRLEASQAKRESRRDRLASASLKRIGQPEDVGNGEEFRENVRFHLDHLPRLATRPEHVKELRQTILNLAVRGKLVPQDPNDEPALELLKRIYTENKLHGSRQGLSCKNGINDQSVRLPSGWVLVKFEELLKSLQTGPFGSSLHQSDYEIGGVPVVNPASLVDQRIVPVAKMSVGLETLDRLSSFKLKVNDIVLARRGEMGRCAIVTENEDGWLCGTGSLILRLPNVLPPDYVSLLIGSPAVREYLGSVSVGSTMQNLNQSVLLNMEFNLPPLAEQHRIVAKVDELMNLCDQLEVHLAANQTNQSRLLEATLCDALGVTCLPVSRPSRPVPSLKRVVATHSEQPPTPITPRPGPVEIPTAAVQGSLIEQPTKPRAENGDVPGAILAQMQPGQEYSRAQLAEALGLSVYEWNMAIRELKESGRVVQKGERRGARYSINLA